MAPAPHCPRDGQPLLPDQRGGYACGQCCGVFVGIAVLRHQMVDRQVANALWRSARSAEAEPGLPCPNGEHPMHQAVLATDDHPSLTEPVTLDVCLPCQQVWADAGELEQLPPSS